MLHSIHEIAPSLAAASDRRVRLARNGGAIVAPNLSGTAQEQPGEEVNPTKAIETALAAPLDYPPLRQSILPGDRVAIALDDSVPQIAEIVRGALRTIYDAGSDSVTIVTAEARTAELCREKLLREDIRLPRFLVHEPDNENELCLVGLTKKQKPVLVNRTIFDADVVLPIGCARLENRGAYDSLFPRFSSREAIDDSRKPANWRIQKTRRDQRASSDPNLVDEAGWLIGVPMTVQIIPGENETVAGVVAGEPQAVARRCDELTRRRWLVHSRQHVSLVIATITGGAEAQNWTNVGRALMAAAPLLEEGGAVAICSNLNEPPGASIGRLIDQEDLERIERIVSQDHNADSRAAWELVRALQRGPVYLLSQLDAETVEDLGLAPVLDIDELSRLAGRHQNFAIIEDAQHTITIVDT